jgi:hypothetical protein
VLLAECSCRTVRQEASGPASRAGRFLKVQHIFLWSHCLMSVGDRPRGHLPWAWLLILSSHTYTQHNTTPSPPSHSLSLLLHGHHLHCPWSQDLDPSTAREPLYELQGPTPFDSHPLEPLSSNLGQEQGICNLPSISLLDAYLEECFWLWIPAK